MLWMAPAIEKRRKERETSRKYLRDISQARGRVLLSTFVQDGDVFMGVSVRMLEGVCECVYVREKAAQVKAP